MTASRLLGAGHTQGSEILIDLVDVDVHGVSGSQHRPWGTAATDPRPSAPLWLLGEELLCLGNVSLLQLNIFISGFSCGSSHRHKDVSVQGRTSLSPLQEDQHTSTRAIIFPPHR